MPIIRGILGPHTFDDVPWHTHDYSEISGQLVVTEAEITSLSASKLTSGEIDAQTITLAAGGVIKSADYVGGDGGTGFQITGGLAEFNNVTVRGLLIADTPGSDMPAEYISAGTLDSGVINTGALNADNITSGTMSADFISGGTISGDLISGGTITGTTINAGTITTGTLNADNVTITNIGGSSIKDDAIDEGHINVSSLSAIQVSTGSLSVTGRIELGSNGVFASSDSSDPRIEIVSTAVDRIQWITTLANETSSARIRAVEHVSGYPQLEIYGPNGNTSIDMYSGPSGSARYMQLYGGNNVYLVGGSAAFRVGPTNVAVEAGSLDMGGGNIQNVNEIYADVGASNDPSYTFDGYTSTGLYCSSGALWMTVIGSAILGLGAAELVPMNKIKSNYYGSATAPAYSWNNDPDTGIYHIGTGGYFAATTNDAIAMQWGPGANKFIYQLTTGATNAMQYNSGSGQITYVSSSRTIKKNIKPFTDIGLTDRLQVFSYKMRAGNADDPNRWHIGLVAEDTIEVDERFGIDQIGDLHPDAAEQATPPNYIDRAVLGATIADLQDARKRIAVLEERLERLESLVAAA